LPSVDLAMNRLVGIQRNAVLENSCRGATLPGPTGDRKVVSIRFDPEFIAPNIVHGREKIASDEYKRRFIPPFDSRPIIAWPNCIYREADFNGENGRIVFLDSTENSCS